MSDPVSNNETHIRLLCDKDSGNDAAVEIELQTPSEAAVGEEKEEDAAGGGGCCQLCARGCWGTREDDDDDDEEQDTVHRGNTGI